MQPQHIYISATEITETITQGTPLFFGQLSLEKPNAGKRCNKYEGVIIMQFLNTTRVPKMALPSENCLGRSTSPWRQIFWLISHWMIDPTATMAAQLDNESFSTALRHSPRDCVTLLAHQHSVYPTKITQRYLLALRQLC